MRLPDNIDDYQRYMPMADDELRRESVHPAIIERMHRLRSMYSRWLSIPTCSDREMVYHDMEMFGVEKTQAYEDVNFVKLLLGNMQGASKDFMRWKINQDLEDDLAKAREAADWKSVAALEKCRILNNRTDKKDEIELAYDKIIPQPFEPTDDPSAIGITAIPGLREKIRKLKKRYGAEIDKEYTDYRKVNDGADPGQQE